MTELYVRDVRRDGTMEKMPKMPSTYLYPHAREQFPEMSPRSLSSMEHSLKAKYRAIRYKLIWTREAVLPTYRYPVPFPINNQSWSIRFESDDPALITFPVSDHRWTVRLRGGSGFRRQREALQQLVRAEGIKGELALFRSRSNTNDHRNGVKGRSPGGQAGRNRVMAKIVAWLPRKSTSPSKVGTLFVRSDADRFLVASNENDQQIWVLNADHVRRWAAEHQRRLKRWSEDQKTESRPVTPFADRRSTAVTKYRRRLHTFCHEVTAQLSSFASRRGFEAVQYDDSRRDYVSTFPWFDFRSMLQVKLDEVNIKFNIAEAQPDGDSREEG